MKRTFDEMNNNQKNENPTKKRKIQKIQKQEKPIITFYHGKYSVPTFATPFSLKSNGDNTTFDSKTVYPIPDINTEKKIVFHLIKITESNEILFKLLGEEEEEKKEPIRYPYIFYEFNFDFDDFIKYTSIKMVRELTNVVEKSKIMEYLTDYLKKLDFTIREIADFITYWVPRLLELQSFFIGIYRIPKDIYDKLIEMKTCEVVQYRFNFIFYEWEGKIPLKENVIKEELINKDKPYLVEWGATIVYESALSPKHRFSCFYCKKKFDDDDLEIVEEDGMEVKICSKCSEKEFVKNDDDKEEEEEEEEEEK